MTQAESGDTVELSYTPAVGRGNGRNSLEVTIEDKMGEITYFANPFGEGTPTLVLLGDGDLYARDESGNDGIYGFNARIES